MKIDEGYIKYRSDWTRGPAPPAATVAELNAWRSKLFAAGLIGYDEQHQVGFGNLSVRAPARDQFVISGTQTGGIECTRGEHYAIVTRCDIDANCVSSIGPVEASSEAMTHAALYALDEAIEAVVHVHSDALWRRFLGELPTTSADIAYGTPAMARDFDRLWQETSFRTRGVAVMAGHPGGLVSIGGSLRSAAERILELHEGGALL